MPLSNGCRFCQMRTITTTTSTTKAANITTETKQQDWQRIENAVHCNLIQRIMIMSKQEKNGKNPAMWILILLMRFYELEHTVIVAIGCMKLTPSSYWSHSLGSELTANCSIPHKSCRQKDYAWFIPQSTSDGKRCFSVVTKKKKNNIIISI